MNNNDPTTILMRHQWREAARNMYKGIARDQNPEPGEAPDAPLLEAAGHADFVIDGLWVWPAECGHWKVSVGAMEVNLKSIEAVAYSLLERRATVRPSNRFRDTGARWFK